MEIQAPAAQRDASPHRIPLIRSGFLAVALALAGCAPAQAEAAQPPSARPQAVPPASMPSATSAAQTTAQNTVQNTMTALQEAEPGTLEVSGVGEVTIPSDRARVSFAVETEGSTAGEAARANADAMDAAIRALRGSGAAGLEIETHGYGLNPMYAGRSEPNQPPRIAGYRAVNTVTVTTTDVDAVGSLIDTATEAGVNRIASLVFDATDTEAARHEALAEAVRRARSEAEAIAGALGTPLGRVLRVRGGAEEPGFRPQVMYAARAMEAAPTPVEAAGQTVRASVTVTFALGSP